MSVTVEVATEAHIRELVLAALEGDEADPRTIASNVAELLPEEMLRETVAHTLHLYVRQLSRMRARASTSDGSNHSPKWARVEENRGAIELLRQRVYARGDWKLLGDCDETDCLDLARLRERHARTNAKRAKQFRVLAGALKQRSLSGVREMPADALEAIFSA